MTHPLALPKTFSPDALDTTAELAVILARLQPPTSTGSGGAGTTPLPASGASGAAAAGGAGDAAGAGANGLPPISLRDLPTTTDSLKHKLQQARAQIKTLPDVGRTIAAQEAEMRQLQARIEAQRAMLVHLRAEGARIAAADEQEQGQSQDGDRMEM